MSFTAHTQQELQALNLEEESMYTIQYLNRDYFNGEENIELAANARAIINEDEILFVVTDPYGMDKFIKEARVLKQG